MFYMWNLFNLNHMTWWNCVRLQVWKQESLLVPNCRLLVLFACLGSLHVWVCSEWHMLCICFCAYSCICLYLLSFEFFKDKIDFLCNLPTLANNANKSTISRDILLPGLNFHCRRAIIFPKNLYYHLKIYKAWIILGNLSC